MGIETKASYLAHIGAKKEHASHSATRSPTAWPTCPRGKCSVPNGRIGVYIAPDPGAKGDAKKGIYPFPVADFFDKGITMGSGQAPAKKYNEYLRDLIVNARAKPSKIVSHRIHIDEAPDAYDKFDKRIEGYTKVLIKFEEDVAA